MANCVENYLKRKMEITKHMQKKHNHSLALSQRYQDSRHLLQNPTVPKYFMGFSNRAQIFTPLNYLSLDSPFLKIWNYVKRKGSSPLNFRLTLYNDSNTVTSICCTVLHYTTVQCNEIFRIQCNEVQSVICCDKLGTFW